MFATQLKKWKVGFLFQNRTGRGWLINEKIMSINYPIGSYDRKPEYEWDTGFQKASIFKAFRHRSSPFDNNLITAAWFPFILRTKGFESKGVILSGLRLLWSILWKPFAVGMQRRAFCCYWGWYELFTVYSWKPWLWRRSVPGKAPLPRSA